MSRLRLLCRRLLQSLLLGIVTTLVFAWVLPFAGFVYNRSTPLGAWGTEYRWADDDPDGARGWATPRAGRYMIRHHWLCDTIEFRIIFAVQVRMLPYYRQNAPPAWAATLSADRREGYEQVNTTTAGWPFRCFRGEHWIRWGPTAPAPGFAPRKDTVLRFTRGTETGYVPLQPVWPALLANIACSFVAWSLIFSIVHAARTLARRRHSLCPSCAYSRAGLAPDSPCPECGGRLI